MCIRDSSLSLSLSLLFPPSPIPWPSCIIFLSSCILSLPHLVCPCDEAPVFWSCSWQQQWSISRLPNVKVFNGTEVYLAATTLLTRANRPPSLFLISSNGRANSLFVSVNNDGCYNHVYSSLFPSHAHARMCVCVCLCVRMRTRACVRYNVRFLLWDQFRLFNMLCKVAFFRKLHISNLIW